MRIVLHEAEAAGGFVEAVEAHYQPFDLAAFGEEFVDLFFRGVEGEVAYVEGCCVGEFFRQVGGGAAVRVGFGGGAFAFFVLLESRG